MSRTIYAAGVIYLKDGVNEEAIAKRLKEIFRYAEDYNGRVEIYHGQRA